MEGDEAFDAACLGECNEVSEERVGDGELLYFRGCKNGSACTVVLRGANEYMLDEMDRSLHDALCVIKRMIESNSLVAGGGAVEAALSIYLDGIATSMDSREQLAVAQFAEALLVIPRTLSVNAAQDATELVAQLRAQHHTSQTVAGKELLHKCFHFLCSLLMPYWTSLYVLRRTCRQSNLYGTLFHCNILSKHHHHHHHQAKNLFVL
jgi:T-complex protein 1 subunit alpha